MEHLDIVIWIIGFPIGYDLSNYLTTLRKEITNESHNISDDTFGGWVWIIVTLLLIIF